MVQRKQIIWSHSSHVSGQHIVQTALVNFGSAPTVFYLPLIMFLVPYILKETFFLQVLVHSEP